MHDSKHMAFIHPTTHLCLQFVIICIFLVVIVIPILSFVVWLGIWFLPLKLSEQKRLYFVAECLSSWSSTDVFVIAVVMMTTSVSDLEVFAAGNKLDGAADGIEVMRQWGIVDQEPYVIGAKGVWHIGILFLAIAGVLSNVVYLLMSAAAITAIRDREKQAWMTSLYVLTPPPPPQVYNEMQYKRNRVTKTKTKTTKLKQTFSIPPMFFQHHTPFLHSEKRSSRRGEDFQSEDLESDSGEESYHAPAGGLNDGEEPLLAQ